MRSLNNSSYIRAIVDSIVNRLNYFPLLTYPLRVIERKFRVNFFYRNYLEIITKQLEKINFNEIYEKRKFPARASIEINNTCNLNCLMCNTQLSKRPPGYIKPAVFEKILQQLKKIGITKIALHTVGEPLICKDLNLLLQIVKNYSFKINLSTNGQVPKRLGDLIKLHSDLIRYIRFSIDGAKPKTYELIRKGGKFSRLIESLEIVHEFNHYKIDFKLPVRIDVVLSITNINEIPLFFRVFGKYCWPESINFNLITGLSPDTNFFWETFPFPNLIKRTIPCPLPFNYIYFTYDGKITLCCRDYDGELIVGDLKSNSILEVWNGEKSEFIRKQNIYPELLNIESCKRCFEPYSFISEFINYYIHYLYYYYPNLSTQDFGRLIKSFLETINNEMQHKDIDLIKQKILLYFNR